MTDRTRHTRSAAIVAMLVVTLLATGCPDPDPGVTEDDLRPLTVAVLPWTESNDELTYDVGEERFDDLEDLEEYLRLNVAAVSRVDVTAPAGHPEAIEAARRLVEHVLPGYNVPAALEVTEMDLPKKPKKRWFEIF